MKLVKTFRTVPVSEVYVTVWTADLNHFTTKLSIKCSFISKTHAPFLAPSDQCFLTSHVLLYTVYCLQLSYRNPLYVVTYLQSKGTCIILILLFVVISSPVTEAHLGLEGTVVLAASQTAALITAQRWDQMDRP